MANDGLSFEQQLINKEKQIYDLKTRLINERQKN